MREWILILCFVASAGSTGADEAFWVLFSDRGDTAGHAGIARTALSARCLARRAKMRGEGAPLVDEEDLPVCDRYVEAVAERGARIRHRSRWLNAVSVMADDSVLGRVAALPFVRAIRPIPRYARTLPEPLRAGHDEPDYGAAQAQLAQIRVPLLHAMGYSGAGVLVCLLDTGFYKDHESLRDLHLVAERDFVFGDDDTQRDPSNPQDFSDGHGTAVWSALAGYRPGALVGPAYGASFLLAKTEDLRYELPIEEDNWVAGIEWADSAGADVVSSSLAYTTFDGGTGYTQSDLDGDTAVTTIAADRAAALGIAVVVAAGNYRGTSWGTIGTPADADSIIAVGAVDASGTIASFSSPGPTADGRIKPEVCARGVATACASNYGPSSYGISSGTSLSTPLVAGVAALLLEINPQWTGADVRQRLMETASRADAPDNDYGWGIVDAFAASGIAAPVAVLAGWTVDDDDQGESLGNGNGVLEPGERIELRVFVGNAGSAPTGEIACTLTSLHEALSLLRDASTAPSADPGDTVSVREPFVLEYAAWGPIDIEVWCRLTVQDEAAETLLTAELSFPVASLYRVDGLVLEHGGAPVPQATVRVIGPAGTAVDTAAVGADGSFGLWLPQGLHWLQARAAGFVSPDAVQMDPSSSDAVVLELARPRMAPVDTVRIAVDADSAACAELVVTNAGTGTLRAHVQVMPYGDTVRWREDWVTLRVDPREGSCPDLVRMCGKATESLISLRLGTAALWPASGYVATIGLDVDGDETNGRLAAGLLSDYSVQLSGGARLMKDIGGRWMFVAELEFSVEDTTVTIEIPTALVSLPAQPVIRMAVSVETVAQPPVEVDRLPDDGGDDPVTWSLQAPAWLASEPEPLTIEATASSIIALAIDARLLAAGVYRGDLMIQGRMLPMDPVPILLTVSASDTQGPSELPVALTLGPPVPNPATDAFQVSIGLPESSPVELELVDLAGRRLFRWPLGVLPAGWSEVSVQLGPDGPRGAFWLRASASSGRVGRMLVRG